MSSPVIRSWHILQITLTWLQVKSQVQRQVSNFLLFLCLIPDSVSVWAQQLPQFRTLPLSQKRWEISHHWNCIGPFLSQPPPQKVLLLLSKCYMRAVQVESGTFRDKILGWLYIWIYEKNIIQIIPKDYFENSIRKDFRHWTVAM